ncbi:molybdate-anion transporter [Punica granatum]|uniref:Molybdate-anion transporter n=1 Tax=Punica granatum TaxID=22663 RepID=A0A6P8DQG4_PUNGR|nr:molybdate-anion transporter [Punica granatum]XP_031396615.1 molybdate-anion transporter [Punica granatum]
MGVVIESSVWEPNASLFVFIFFSCLLSVFLLPYATKSSSPSPFQLGVSPSFLRFKRNFLLIYSLASVLGGIWSVFGEFEWSNYGVSREQMVLILVVGFGASLLVGTSLGVLSDIVGQRKMTLIFCLLHLFVGVWKRLTAHPSVWLASICLSVASSIFSYSFETWMVLEHEKQGHRQDLLSDTFWLMTFFESASLIGSQALANRLVRTGGKTHLASAFSATILLALISIICISWLSKESYQAAEVENRKMSYASVLPDKRIWLLAYAQASVHFSVSIVWILWAPTLVADGREVHLGLIYPCLLGARMLGTAIFPWVISGSSLRTEECLVYTFIISGLAVFIIAYDYQEIGVLVSLFCLFHACIGIILPSLARLRTMYVPNELRGGMISLSLAPANAAVLLFLLQGGYYRNVGNSAIMGLSAIGLFSSAACMHFLKRLGKQPYSNWHKL